MPQRRLATRRFLATVLFTDIVGSTERAARLGDRAWRDLLERHHAVVRRELRAFGGREMDTAGDGFFAVFEAPERAVRCAESITSAMVSLEIQVRAGVHIGECEVIGGKVGGMTVNIAARIKEQAGSGAVLVSGSVRDLMTGSDRHFEGGDLQELKGVADPWRVYRLVPEQSQGVPAQRRRTPMMPVYSRRQKRHVVLAVAAIAALALALSGVYILTRTDPEVVVGEDEVGVIGPGDEARVSAAFAVGQRPTALAAGSGVVWVTNSTADSVSRIDPDSDLSVPINLEPGSSPSGVAVGAGAVWVANSGNATVSRIDPATSRVTTIEVRPGPTGIMVAFGSVWVTNALDASVTEIDPDTSKILKVVAVGAGPTGIAAGAGYLWVTNQGDGTVTRFDPDTYVADSAINVGKGPAGIAVGDGAAWVANNLDGSLSRIDVKDLSVNSRTLDKGGGAYGVAASDGTVWVSNEHAETLMRVRARTFQLGATVRLRGAPLGLAFVGDDLWFTSAEGGSPLHRGGVLTMVGPRLRYEWLGDKLRFDPTVQWDEQSWRLATLTYDGLVGFRRAGGVEGVVPVPDLATDLPTPTDGGLTYAFHLREGVRYSTGEPVLAGDIRRGIERAVVSGSSPPYYAEAIVGAQACAHAAAAALADKKPRPDCDLSAGITADDRTGAVTMHLTKPTPDFLYQLALPVAFAVPQDTPVDLAPGEFPPATGPYMIHSHTPKQDAKGARPARLGRLELVRNPQFHVWSPAAQPDGYPDRIVLRTGYTEKQAVARVADGRADVLWFGAPQADMDRLATRYSSQLHKSAGQETHFVYLNATKAPFDKRDARRAVAYALDRGALTGDRNRLSGPVTCQILPPDFVAYRPYCPFTLGGGDDGKWTGLDLATAQDLVERSGTRGARVVLAVAKEDPQMREAGRRVVAVLRRLDYHASLRAYPFEPDFFDVLGKRTDWDVGVWGWVPDYPAPSQLLAALASCDPDLEAFNLAHYCDPELERAIAAALDLQATDPAGASNAWAAIDRMVVNAAAIIPYGNNLREDFVSRRVGNVQVHPVTGPLIAQMWVQ